MIPAGVGGLGLSNFKLLFTQNSRCFNENLVFFQPSGWIDDFMGILKKLQSGGSSKQGGGAQEVELEKLAKALSGMMDIQDGDCQFLKLWKKSLR